MTRCHDGQVPPERCFDFAVKMVPSHSINRSIVVSRAVEVRTRGNETAGLDRCAAVRAVPQPGYASGSRSTRAQDERGRRHGGSWAI